MLTQSTESTLWGIRAKGSDFPRALLKFRGPDTLVIGLSRQGQNTSLQSITARFDVAISDESLRPSGQVNLDVFSPSVDISSDIGEVKVPELSHQRLGLPLGEVVGRKVLDSVLGSLDTFRRSNIAVQVIPATRHSGIYYAILNPQPAVLDHSNTDTMRLWIVPVPGFALKVASSREENELWQRNKMTAAINYRLLGRGGLAIIDRQSPGFFDEMPIEVEIHPRNEDPRSISEIINNAFQGKQEKTPKGLRAWVTSRTPYEVTWRFRVQQFCSGLFSLIGK